MATLDRLLEMFMSYTNWVWGWPILIMFCVVSVSYTVLLKGFQFRYAGLIFRNTFGKILAKKETHEVGVSPVQAVASAMASTLGTGSIAGVAIAIGLGGPGAIFWMWVIASLSLILKYAEVTLAVHFREKRPGEKEYRGGFMYMLINGCGKQWKWLASVWALLMAIQMAMAPAVHSNAVASTIEHSFGVPPLVCGVVASVLAGIVLLGGVQRIARFAETVVPFMTIVYCLGSLGVILMNITLIPAAFATIFSYAFSPAAAGGGFAGATVTLALRHGMARGIFAHEAGMGTAPFCHAQANTDDPCRQGLWGIFEVFVTIFIVCTSSALVILTTGVMDSGIAPGAAWLASALSTVYPGNLGDIIVAVTLALFAYTTMVVVAYYGEKCFEFLTDTPKYSFIYRVICCLSIIVGSVGGFKQVWGVYDGLMSLTVMINVLVIIALRKEVVAATATFLEKIRKEEMEEQDELPGTLPEAD